MSEERKRGLGRGLSALLGEEAAPAPVAERQAGIRALPVERLRPGRFQPRRTFDEEHMRALAESVAAQGVLQPLLVRPHPDMPDYFEIIAGERRWRAAQRAKLHEVPAIVRALDDRAALEVALVENIQRQDLQPLEEARGFLRLIEEFGYTQETLGARVGKSRSHVANMIRLLSLPEEVKLLLEQGHLTMGHARALLGASDPASLALEVVRFQMTVRDTERAAQDPHREPQDPRQLLPRFMRDPDAVALEKELSAILGLKVGLHGKGGERGQLVISYRTLDQLDEVLAKLRGRERGK
jgi:ParB family transcriptional regulator, chromosome partitioning protein